MNFLMDSEQKNVIVCVQSVACFFMSKKNSYNNVSEATLYLLDVKTYFNERNKNSHPVINLLFSNPVKLYTHS
jgi:hypothetical protein